MGLSAKCLSMLFDIEDSNLQDYCLTSIPRRLIEDLVSKGYPEPHEIFKFEDEIDIVWKNPPIDITFSDGALFTTVRAPIVMKLDDIVVKDFDLPEITQDGFYETIRDECIKLLSSIN